MLARPWRQRILFGALAVAIILSAASGLGRQPPQDFVPPRESRAVAATREPVQPALHIELERLRGAATPDKDGAPGNAFQAMSWYVPPPPPKPLPPPPPPPPTAPPMPFSFMGRYEDGGRRIILLVRGDLVYAVSEGDVIDNTYRVERMNAAQVELTYLPLNIKQTISTGGS